MAEDDVLKQPFDLAVEGTGLICSILAAAASRVGKRVIHADSRTSYGRQWACPNPSELGQLGAAYVATMARDSQAGSHLPKAFTRSLVICDLSGMVYLIWWCIARGLDPKHKCDVSSSNLLRNNTTRYLDFKPLAQLFQHDGEKATVVPYSKPTLMRDRLLSPRDKRVLVRFLQKVVSEASEAAAQPVSTDRTFVQYLQQDHGLSDSLCHLGTVSESSVMPGLKMSDKPKPPHAPVPTQIAAGLAAMARFMSSLGVYTETPLLLNMYGNAEIAQAFCRLSAVYGGIYMLQANAPAEPQRSHADEHEDSDVLIAPDSICRPAWTWQLGEFNVGCHRVVRTALPHKMPGRVVARLVAVTRHWPTCLDSQGCADLALLSLLYPAEAATPAAPPVEVDADSTTASADPIVFSATFTQSVAGVLDDCCYEENDGIVYVADRWDGTPSLDDAVQRAQRLFEFLFPGEEFLPPIPDPEDVVFDATERVVIKPATTAFGTMYLPMEAYCVDPTSQSLQVDKVLQDDLLHMVANNTAQHAVAQGRAEAQVVLAESQA
ncbi:uncharacterized protein MONBRDRAFT_28367 [Monosiga brevicollis MX1]|uniref:Rab proteins geranylgeranyltransferase component A n=1 Tax=Monosiga brevicollis TaxID=81824 RepID=A9V7Z0_MONBE|nr:uncharacterized protein MONBRDRAFT_28367 [Monosiga brevicollis MX1]EDQ86389.1 predicted protein [Monosiga brevicollis MX1]|eukprot:XP_001748779.1 hypothetical protein [Monosiga brevicollis MX1]